MPKNHTATSRKSAKASTGSGHSGLIWFVAGLTLGAIGSSAFFMGKPFQIWATNLIQSSSNRNPLASNQEITEPEPEPAGKEPQFDFYTILPEAEVSIPDHPQPPKDAAAVAVAKAEQKQYILQAGSFGELAQADRQKALLAMLGIEAKIETLSVDGGKTRHRLLIGPFSDIVQLKAIEQQLLQNNIKTLPLELKKIQR